MDNNPATNDSRSSTILYILIGFFSLVICLSLCGIVAVLVFGLNMSNPGRSSTPPPPVGSPNDLTVQAVTLMNEGRYEEALPLWTAVIVQAPYQGTAYYQRALCYYNLLPQQADIQSRQTYAQNALADLDRAIAIQPDLGDYYSLRHDVIVAFTGWEEYRVDQQAIVRIAHQNVGAAITLGYSDTYRFTDRVYFADLTTLEQCDQSLAGIQRLLEATAPGDTTITGIQRMEAEANACLGNYEEAVRAIDASLQSPASPVQKTYLKAVYLYQLGELDEALAVLNASIDSEPNYTGYRYYLRALIYYDLGENDRANADLETGLQNTWARMGLYAYVSGKMALAAGEQDKGIDLLQQAEASLDHNHMLIRAKIVEELAEPGAEPLSLTPSIKIDATPIPIQQP